MVEPRQVGIFVDREGVVGAQQEPASNDAVMPSSDNLVIRSAPHYWGPWSQPATLATHQRYPGLYGGFMNPHFLSDNGHTIYFVMSQWDVYSVFWMKASLSIRRSTDSVSSG